MARILIVDDDQQVRTVFRRILENAGYDIDEASDGIMAARRYRDQPADLIILDIIMPEQEGLGTIIELRRQNPSVKIIAISGGGRMDAEDYLSTARKLGASSSLEKPVTTAALLSEVESLLDSP